MDNLTPKQISDIRAHIGNLNELHAAIMHLESDHNAMYPLAIGELENVINQIWENIDNITGGDSIEIVIQIGGIENMDERGA